MRALLLAAALLAGCAELETQIIRREVLNAPCWRPCVWRAPAGSSLAVRLDEKTGLCLCQWVDDFKWPHPLARIEDDYVSPERSTASPKIDTTTVTVERR